MMSPERYSELEEGESELTSEEIAAGWHFCLEWDFMLINACDPDGEKCDCKIGGDDHSAISPVEFN